MKSWNVSLILVCTMESFNFGTIECAPFSKSLTNTKAQFVALTFMPNNHCLCPEVTTTKSKFGITNWNDAYSIYLDIWITSEQPFSITSTLGFCQHLTIKQFVFGTGNLVHVFQFWLDTIIMWCVQDFIQVKIFWFLPLWTKLFAFGTFQVHFCLLNFSFELFRQIETCNFESFYVIWQIFVKMKFTLFNVFTKIFVLMFQQT